MNSKRFQSIAAGTCAAAMCFLIPVGCTERTPKPAANADRAPDATYTTRGEVKAVPNPAKITSQLVIMHEPIDNFVDPRTGALGMNSMEMPFDLPKNSALLQGLMEGDKIEMTLGVWYIDAPGQVGKKQIDRYSVTMLKKLPPATELKFGRASPPLGSTPQP